ncbi:MAG: NYN domain-containing protein [Eubacteriales bacterium]
MDEKNIALLIDMDNVSAKYVKSMFDELNSYGTVSIRRIYGNWKKPNGWTEDDLLEHSIQPIQQFDYTKGKNATDMAMVIDAMDILYSHSVDMFCIVTSDSDFTKLAMRLRESKAFVIGMGESKTPMALTKACNKFVYLDLNAKKLIINEIISFIKEHGGVVENLSTIYEALKSKHNDFSLKDFGFSRISTFLKSIDEITVDGNKVTLKGK